MSELPALYQAVRRDLATLKDLVAIKHVRDKAVGLESYAMAAKDGALMGEAVEVRKWATRVLGERIEEKRKAGGLAKGAAEKGVGRRGRNAEDSNPRIPTLADQGIDKDLAKTARAAARMDEAKFRKAIEKAVAVAVATIEGAKAIITAARAESHQQKRKARAAREQAVAEKIIALPKKKYGVILADPEWRFEFWSEKGKTNSSADNHYETSPLDEIKKRDVASIAADDCALFLWATSPMLPQALEVMAAWGFNYVSAALWVKDRAGTGYWFRNKHELLLLGTRGKPPAPAPGDQWDSVIEAPVGKHSAKPDVFYKLIESYFHHLPKIELNARKARPGWDSWGLEAPREAAE
jgi:N6-adenosine-specific RNA methylase IME4